ncbi:hypothetical protein G6O69_34735 [Pseudenhygromyxa sp. WMMC2535]|uniref:hypothetical protein n=1 Tax=Pseudenhygromyxa sp. WMMC2535 TaxID=2712867 RepID=UPI0015579B7B|nr:hypothetical protein [Pseudenhygromyxa sp. WMMC2535]NVB43031.1 hypothetical protein [Pseudenhygromyxa sp. WMMC2535]
MTLDKGVFSLREDSLELAVIEGRDLVDDLAHQQLRARDGQALDLLGPEAEPIDLVAVVLEALTEPRVTQRLEGRVQLGRGGLELRFVELPLAETREQLEQRRAGLHRLYIDAEHRVQEAASDQFPHGTRCCGEAVSHETTSTAPSHDEPSSWRSITSSQSMRARVLLTRRSPPPTSDPR